jgi:hypothetical protein
MRLTAILAHPEDTEIWAGGTTCKHVARGEGAYRVHGRDRGLRARGGSQRRLTLPKVVKEWSLQSVQLKLIKTGARLVRQVKRLSLADG